MPEKIAMISQPMAGLSTEAILKTKNEVTKLLESQGYKIVNTFFEDYHDGSMTLSEAKNRAVICLGLAIQKMGFCDTVYFVKGWENSRGCKIEHQIAKDYGLEIIYQN